MNIFLAEKKKASWNFLDLGLAGGQTIGCQDQGSWEL